MAMRYAFLGGTAFCYLTVWAMNLLHVSEQGDARLLLLVGGSICGLITAALSYQPVDHLIGRLQLKRRPNLKVR